jgi:hypothetical protein
MANLLKDMTQAVIHPLSLGIITVVFVAAVVSLFWMEATYVQYGHNVAR